MFVLQESRHPEKIKPPDRVGEKFSQRERPRLPQLHQPRPFYFSTGFLRIAAAVQQFRFGNPGVVLRRAINQEPDGKPDEPDRPDSDERRSPAPVHDQPPHTQRRNNAAYASSRAENARPERPLLF